MEYVPGLAELTVSITGHAGVDLPPGEQLLPELNVGELNPADATATKLMLSVLCPGQTFSARGMIATPAPELAPIGTVTVVELVVTATHGTVHVVAHTELLNNVPV